MLIQFCLLIEYVELRQLLSRSKYVTVWVWGGALPSELKQIRLLIEYVWMRSLFRRSRFVCWLSIWGCVVFCVEANLFADWLCGNAFPFERKQIRLLFEIESMRYLLSWNRFVCRLSMWGCVPFWVEADSLPNWVCGDVFAFEWKQIRFLIEKWGCVSFWVEANTFTVWDWGYALPSELKQIRLQIEYVGMRSLLSRSRFVT